VPRVEIDLWPDPNMISDAGYTIESSLDVCVCADENAIANLESFNVLETHSASDANPIAKLLCNRAPYSAPHQAIQFAVSVSESAIVLQ
jgi:hypothetical protein